MCIIDTGRFDGNDDCTVNRRMRNTNDPRQNALLSFLGLGEAGEDDLGVEESSFENNAFTVDGGEYLVLTDSEADDRAADDIKQSLWAFNTSFIMSHTELPDEASEMVLMFQERNCESANDTIEALITDLDSFIEDAISADGRGHFISRYDGNEGESGEYFIYRIN